MVRGQQITLAHLGAALVTAFDRQVHKSLGILNPNDGEIYLSLNGPATPTTFDYIIPPECYGIFPGPWQSLGLYYVDLAGLGSGGTIILYADDSYQLNIPTINAIGRAANTSTVSSYIDLAQITTPGAPSGGLTRLFARSSDGAVEYELPSGVIVPLGGIVLIAEQVLSASAGTVSFTNIPATYRHLLLRTAVRDISAAQNINGAAMTFNGDSGANYGYAYVQNNVSTVSGNSNGATTNLPMVQQSNGGNVANTFAMTLVEIPFYSQSGMRKRALMNSGDPALTYEITIFGGWTGIVPINRVDINANVVGNFAIGSIFDLYGML